MAARNFQIALKRDLAYEGGYSNHPRDPGGPTLEGITQRVYDAWRRANGKPTRPLVPNLRGRFDWIAERDAIYKTQYWKPCRCDDLPSGVDAAVFDYAVNSGPGRAIRVLQRLIGVKADGVIGPKTLDAVSKRNPKTLVAAICAERLAFLKSLNTWGTFGGGWSRRVADVLAYASALAKGAKPPAAEKYGLVDPVAKGEVPEPKAVKGTVMTGTILSAGSGLGFVDWIAAHPYASVAIAVAAAGAVAGAIYLINRWHKARQEAPTPGIGVVPELS